MQTAETCANCGAGPDMVEPDGFCSSCGVQRAKPWRDHMEIVVAPTFAGVSDRGRTHHRNEDFVAMLKEPAGPHVLVVCDGVSSTADADKASEAAAENAMKALLRGSTMEAAIAAAQKAVALLAGQLAASAESPATTIVAAVVEPAPPGIRVTVGWLGDSRAYWITENEVKPLTRDHSWLTEMLESGKMDEQEALRSPQAHAVTGWLGSDSGGLEPSIVTFDFATPGSLLLCSDGLWNYAPDPTAIAHLFGKVHGDALSKARQMVDFANQSGGKDNISVILLTI